jgi:non-specific serine/threonine protein kinase
MIAIPSVALFVDRAQHVCADFQLTQRNASAVAELCRRLDGMPLAIELAATWAKTLSLQQMLLQLSRRFDFLVTRRRDVPIRHQKMLAIIESSYMQLAPALRKFFVKLAVFQGGWTLEAAEGVCEAPLAMPWLQELLERTLITSSPLETADGCTMRFDMLETIRAFCENQLDLEEKEDLLFAHANYFSYFAKRQGQELHGYTMKMSLQAFIADLPNYRLALATAISLSLWEQPASIALYTYQGWEDLGLFDELREWLERIPKLEMDPRTQAFIIRQQARCNAEVGRMEEAEPLFKQSFEMFQRLGEQEGVASTLGNLALLELSRGDLVSALNRSEEALSLVRAVANSALVARVTLVHGTILRHAGDVDSSRESYRESLTLSNREGHVAAAACNYMAEMEIQVGRYGEAESLSRSSLEILKKAPNLRHELLAWLNLGDCANAQGLPDLSNEHYLTSLDLGRRSCPLDWFAMFTNRIAGIALEREDAWSALVLECVPKRPTVQNSELEPCATSLVETLSEKLGATRSQQAIALGRSMRPAEALRFIEEFLKASEKVAADPATL